MTALTGPNQTNKTFHLLIILDIETKHDNLITDSITDINCKVYTAYVLLREPQMIQRNFRRTK